MLAKEDVLEIPKDDWRYPAFSSETTNNGIVGYTNNPEFICDKNNPIFVIFGDHTRTFDITEESFSVLDNVKVLKPILTNNKTVLLFILSVWRKAIPNLGYARHWKIAKDIDIQLPTKNGKIDFEFMEQFVAELEARQLAELDNYLKVTGLKDYNLTKQEKQALKDFDKLEWSEFDVTGDNGIFDVKNTGNILGSDIVPGSGKTPYLCASAENNAVSSYINYDKNLLDKGNCIFIGGKTFVVTYQKEDFYSNDSHNLVLYLKNQERDRYNQLYLATCINKSLGHKYTWGDSISGKKIKRDKVNLPVKDGNVCFNFMPTFISAIQKLVIKDVVQYNESRLKATEKVIGKV